MSQPFVVSKDYHNLLNSVTECLLGGNLSSGIRELWVKMGTQLEIDGVPKNQISTVMRKNIEDVLYDKKYTKIMPREKYKWHNSTYFLVTKENDWVDPLMARHINLDSNMDQKIVLIHPNPEMRVLFYDIIHLCRIMIKNSKQLSFDDTFGYKEMREFYKQKHTIINNCKDIVDNKTKVSENTEIFLLECLATVLGSTNSCAELFMEQKLIRFKEQNKFLTLKQATKFQRGLKASTLDLLQPISRDTALYSDYRGIQCSCGSWRVRKKDNSNQLECYDCENTVPLSYVPLCKSCNIPLYKERLLHIVKTSKCENCNEIVDLPQELIDYANS